MKIEKMLEEVIPFGRKPQSIIFLVIACVFQFLLFFSPQLANEAVASEVNNIKLAGISKSKQVDISVLNYINSHHLENTHYAIAKEEVVEEKEVIVDEKIEEEIIISSSVHTLTAYNSLPEQTNDQPCITANGFNVCNHGVEDTIAANFLKFGTKVKIPELFGDRIFIVRDRMNKRYPSRVDIWMLEKQDAIEFGVRRARIEIVQHIN